MLEQEEQYAADAIATALQEMGYALPPKMPALRRIPLKGQWGVASSVALQLSKGDKAKAAEIAEGIAERLRALNHFADVRAENGYVNCIFDTDKVATALVHTVLSAGADYGRGAPIAERVMIEYAQMNTHKEFHVGHLRNVALGAALVRIMRFAGYDVVAASYPGDIGLHVIKCLWCYREFHLGKEPKDPAQRGRWLGELYVEGSQRLSFRKDVGEFIEQLVRDDQAFNHAGRRHPEESRPRGGRRRRGEPDGGAPEPQAVRSGRLQEPADDPATLGAYRRRVALREAAGRDQARSGRPALRLARRSVEELPAPRYPLHAVVGAER